VELDQEKCENGEGFLGVGSRGQALPWPKDLIKVRTSVFANDRRRPAISAITLATLIGPAIALGAAGLVPFVRRLPGYVDGVLVRDDRMDDVANCPSAVLPPTPNAPWTTEIKSG
jgi:hypothetical protein